MSEDTLRKIATRSDRIARTTQKLHNILLIISGIACLVTFITTRQLLQLEQEDYADEELYP